MMALLSFPSLAGAQTTLIARLSGAQETPPVTTAATGVAIFTLDASKAQLTYDVITSGLTNITASHIHRGAVGVAGPVIYPLAAGPFTHLTGTLAITPADAADLLVGNLYINVHTEANPAGEIRGQINVPPAGTYLATLNGSQENPPTASTGAGLGVFTLDAAGANLAYELFVTDLTDVTAAHIHQGATGVNGPVIIPIAAGPFTTQSGTSAITPDQVAALNSGGLYANVHTAANPGGEIRGQIFTPSQAVTPPTDSTTWQLPISVTAASAGSDVNGNAGVSIGTAPGASNGWAPTEDLQGPGRPPFNFASVFLIHPNNEAGWENHGGLYIQDTRSPIENGQAEEFKNLDVSSDLGSAVAPATVVLSWGDLSGISTDLKFTLVLPDNLAQGGVATIDMRTQNSFNFQSFATPDAPVVDNLFSIIVTNSRSLPIPIISNLKVSQNGAKSVTITYATDQPSDTKAVYGTAADKLDQTVSDPALVTDHTVTLSNLTPKTQYFFQVSSTSSAGLTGKSDVQNVTTLGGINPVGQIAVTDITPTSATVTFGTDIAATAKVAYGTDPANPDKTIDLATPNTQQSVVLADLEEGKKYTVRITSSAEGFEDLVQTVDFTTTSTSLVVSDVKVENVTGTSAQVTVTTTQPSTVVLKYGTPDLQTNPQTLTDANVSTTHVFQLAGLTASVSYQAQATASATGFPDATSSVVTFSTVQTPITFTVGPTATPGPDAVVISFTNDVATTGEVHYGPTAALGSVVAFTTAATSHNVSITGLQTNATYHYTVMVNAPGRTSATTADATFTTGPISVKGDANGDGKVDIADATQILFFVIGKQNPTPDQIQRSDVAPAGFPDGQLDLRDVSHLLRYIEGLEPL